MSDPLNPSPGLLCKLASITVHAEEYHSSAGHQFDLDALLGVLSDSEVKEWVKQMTDLTLAPRKRSM